MGRRWTRSLVDVGEPTEKNGGAQKMLTLTQSTASATCIVAETVQESLWNPKPSLSLPPPQLVVVVAALPEASRTFRCTRWQLAILNRNCPWSPFHMGSLAKIIGIYLPSAY